MSPNLGARRLAETRFAPALWILLSLLSGVAWGLCHGAASMWLAPWIALVPLFFLLSETARPFQIGFLHGLGAWCAGLPWIVPTLSVFGGVAWPLAIGALLLLASYLALFHAVFAWLVARLWRRRGPAANGGRAVVAAAGCWVALEVLRAWLISGFPWNLAAYSVVATEGALPLAAWIGAYGVSALVVGTNAALGWSLARRSRSGLLLAVLVPFLVLALAARFASAERSAVRGEHPLAVRLVQPDIRNLAAGEHWDAATALAQYRELVETSLLACDRPGALIVWPESAAFPFSLERDDMLRSGLESIRDRGCAVLLNSPRAEGERYFNSAYLMAPGAPLQFADKRHLVPFGEYVPFRDALPFLGKIARMSGDFSPAEDLRLLELTGGTRLGVSICFEIIFPHEVAELARAGATHLVTITNDAWYGDTAAPWQHERAARFRAAENRRSLVRAAITGVSTIVDESGREMALLGPFQKGVLRADLPARFDLSPYARFPWAVPILAVLLGAGAILRRP